jgi:hypothetical protein
MYTADSSLLGAPQATLNQARRFMLARPHTGYSDYDVAHVILPRYWQLCGDVGIDPVLAVAQMIHETGNLTEWWAQRPRRNPAGIGVTGETSLTRPTKGVWQPRQHATGWDEGLAFDTWVDDAIPAHIGRLLAYALRIGAGTVVQSALIDWALTYRPLDRRARGTASTLKPLGAVHNPANAGIPSNLWVAGWAKPGERYGARIAEYATAITRS